MPPVAETRGIRGDEGQSLGPKESKAGGGSIPTASFSLEGLIDGTGTLAMNTGATFTSYWTPPTSGEYEVTAGYFGVGAYNFAPPDDQHRDYAICFESNLSVIRDCEHVESSITSPDLRHRNNGLGAAAAERLLEFLAYSLVAPYLGLVGQSIAQAIIKWAIELEPRDPTSGDFFIDPGSPHDVSISFTAFEGETYAIQYTPSIGFVGESKEDWILTSEVDANYHLDSLGIERQ